MDKAATAVTQTEREGEGRGKGGGEHGGEWGEMGGKWEMGEILIEQVWHKQCTWMVVLLHLLI